MFPPGDNDSMNPMGGYSRANLVSGGLYHMAQIVRSPLNVKRHLQEGSPPP